MASPRQLAYRDRFVWELEQVVSAIFDDCDGLTNRYVFPDMTTRVPMVMYLSQEQFTTLYSAVLTGADLTYPDTSHDVENLFLQMVTCDMAQLCQAIADCIENSQYTQTALWQWLSNEGLTGGVGDPNAPLADDILGGNLLPAGYSCTDDKAFGMALAVVNAIHEATIEVLQAIEIATNPLEIAAELADNVPGVGLLTSGADVANWVQDSAFEQYNLAWSSAIRDELACLLWCDFKTDCTLTYDRIFDVYLQASAASPPPGNTLEAWTAWLIALTFPGSLETVARVSLLGLLAMRYGGSYGQFVLGLTSLETVIALNADASDSGWSTLCDACTWTWCHEFDFTIDEQGWYPLDDVCRGGDSGVYVAGVGWQATFLDGAPGCTSDYVAATLYYDIAATISRMEITYSMDYVNSILGNWFRPTEGLKKDIPPEDATNEVLTWYGAVVATRLEIIPYPTFNGGNNGSATVTKCRIWGTGANPFGTSNC